MILGYQAGRASYLKTWTPKSDHNFRFYRQSNDDAKIGEEEERMRRNTVLLEHIILSIFIFLRMN